MISVDKALIEINKAAYRSVYYDNLELVENKVSTMLQQTGSTKEYRERVAKALKLMAQEEASGPIKSCYQHAHDYARGLMKRIP